MARVGSRSPPDADNIDNAIPWVGPLCRHRRRERLVRSVTLHNEEGQWITGDDLCKWPAPLITSGPRGAPGTGMGLRPLIHGLAGRGDGSANTFDSPPKRMTNEPVSTQPGNYGGAFIVEIRAREQIVEGATQPRYLSFIHWHRQQLLAALSDEQSVRHKNRCAL